MQPFDNLRLQYHNDTSQAIAIATTLTDRRRSAQKVEVSPDLAAEILKHGHLPTCQIKAKLNCTAEHVRAVYRREPYWRELLKMPHKQKPRSVRKTDRKSKYTDEQKAGAVALAKEFGAYEASRRTGIPVSTIRCFGQEHTIEEQGKEGGVNE